MANERYEGVGLDGHYTLAERIFTKIKSLFDTKVKTDVPVNAVFTDTLPTAYCDSAANATTKVAQCTNFSLKNNSYIPINFINGNTVEAFTEVTLNINNTGAKPLYVNWVFEGGQRTSQPFDASTYIIYYTNNAYYLYTNGTLFPYKNTPNISDIRYYTVGSEDNSVEVVEEQGPGLLGHPENWSVDLSVPLATTVSNGLLSAADKIKIDDFEDTKVTQTNTTGDADYRVLFSYDANDTSQTNTARKNTNLKYNPYSQTLTVGTKEDPYARGVITLRGGTNSPAYLDVDGIISVLDSDMGSLFVKSNDIELFSSVDPSYTWDGTNTSLKDALNAIEDTKVTQTESTTNNTYEVLVAGTASTATTTEGVNKSKGFRYNPSKKAVMEGYNTTASGSYSHAEGYGAYALGQHTHAEGYGTTASGSTSHSEGYNTRASGDYSHVEGFSSSAAASYAHAEGYKNIANGEAAHAEGSNTSAPGYYSHTEGYKTVALNKSQHVFGEFNILDNDPYQVMSDERGKWVEIVGNGNSVKRSNARTLDWNGNEEIAGNLTDKWGLQTSRTMFEEDFQQLTQAERDNGTNYYIPDREPLKICDYIYPVGAIYMSVNNISPAILFGGTWERIKDRFLLAAGDDYNAGSTGGEAEHTLTEAELPTISGSWQIHAQENGTIFYIANGYATGTLKSGQYKTQTTATSGAYSQQSPGFKFGQNQPHNNMPPYLTVNVWVRVPDPVQQEEEEGE